MRPVTHNQTLVLGPVAVHITVSSIGLVEKSPSLIERGYYYDTVMKPGLVYQKTNLDTSGEH